MANITNTKVLQGNVLRLSGSSVQVTGTLNGDGAGLTNLTIGQAEDSVYTDGLFTDFTPSTPVGTAVDRFNEVLAGLAPAAPPNLSNLERNNGPQPGMKLVFGPTVPTASYSDVIATGALTAIGFDGTFAPITGPGGGPTRLGVFGTATPITFTLNNSVPANSGTFVNYPNDAFRVPTNGAATYILSVNGTDVSTLAVSDTGSATNSIITVSTASAGKFIGSGQTFDLFFHRTGSVVITSGSVAGAWRNGHNFATIRQSSSLGEHVTNHVDWVFDPQGGASGPAYSFSTPTSASFVVNGSKFLSGIEYFTGSTFIFSSSVTNYYRNSYTTASNGGRTSGGTNLLTSPFGAPPTPTDTSTILQCATSHTASTGIRLLTQSLSSTLTVNNTIGKTGTVILTTLPYLIDSINTANSTTVENFCLEDFRLTASNYDSGSLLGAIPAFPSSSALADGNLAVYNGSLMYPTKILNGGNVAAAVVGKHAPANTGRNYSAFTAVGEYYRVFQNDSNSRATFNLILTGSTSSLVNNTVGLTGNNIQVFIKIPGKTGWRDALLSAPGSTSGIALNDNVGCVQGAIPTDLSSPRSIAINLLTEGLSPNEKFVVKIRTSNAWVGNITRIQTSLV